MLISEKMKTLEYSKSEQIIIDYFIDHKQEITNQSTRSIAKLLYCSPSSIVRVCQKLGFTGYNDFKIQYLKEVDYLGSNFKAIDPNQPFNQQDGISEIANKINILYKETLEDTLSLLTHDLLQDALKILSKYKHISIVTSASQVGIAATFQDKMARIGIQVVVYSSTDLPYYEASYLDPEDGCFILISYTGETERCIRIAKQLNQRKINFITITSYGTNTLSSLSKHCLYVSTREKIRDNIGSYSMNISTIYLLDVLYSNYFNLHYSMNKANKIKYTNEYESYTREDLNRKTDNSSIQ